MTTSKPLGLYVHIPFCLAKCHYCDFLSFSGTTDADQSLYIKYLMAELDWYGQGHGSAGGQPINTRDWLVDTIFIGGGTPSLLSAALIQDLMHGIAQNFNLTPDCEITLESNPRTLNLDKLKAYSTMGINRLSMGLQSLNPDLLAVMGRIHTPDDFMRNYHEARLSGFKNINVDLMFGIPGQSLADWQHTLQAVMALEPEHISFYGLKIEEGTPFYTMRAEKKLKEIGDELDRDMYALAVRELSMPDPDSGQSRYERYELSNAARQGFACRHNLKYWTMAEFLGVGLGAHSYMNGERFSVVTDLADYEKVMGEQIVWRHQNTLHDEISEYIFTGMRRIAGLSFVDYENRFEESIYIRFEQQILKLTRQGLIDLTDDGMRLSPLGIDLSNFVLSEFV